MMQSITDSLIMSKNVQGEVYVLEKGLDIVSCVQYGRDLKSFLDDGYHIKAQFINGIQTSRWQINDEAAKIIIMDLCGEDYVNPDSIVLQVDETIWYDFHPISESNSKLCLQVFNKKKNTHEEIYVDRETEAKIKETISRLRIFQYDKALKIRLNKDFVYGEPDCFVPEENNDHPLCVGSGSQKCEDCSLYSKLDYNSYQ